MFFPVPHKVLLLWCLCWYIRDCIYTCASVYVLVHLYLVFTIKLVSGIYEMELEMELELEVAEHDRVFSIRFFFAISFEMIMIERVGDTENSVEQSILLRTYHKGKQVFLLIEFVLIHLIFCFI